MSTSVSPFETLDPLVARPRADAVLGERDHTPRQRDHVEQLDGDTAAAVARAADFDPAHFGRTATDIDQQSVWNFRVEQIFARGKRQTCFLCRGDDLEVEAGALSHQRQEIVAIAGTATGLGGDVACARHLMAGDLGRAHVERTQGAFDGITTKRPVQRHSFAQPDRAGERVDDLEAVDRRPRHQEPAIVGAEIDGGESVRETTAVPASLLPRSRRWFPGHCGLFP